MSRVPNTATILIADGDPEVPVMLRPALEQDGFTVREAADGLAALAAVERVDPELVLVDVMLPTMDGWEVCRLIRAHHATPIIVLTGHAVPPDRLRCVDFGIDDYVTKPFNTPDVVARVRAALRRAAQQRDVVGTIIHAGALTIDLQTQRVTNGARSVHLTPSEFRLLTMFASHPDQAFTRIELISLVQGHAFPGYARTVDTHIMNLRKKLGGDPGAAEYILTVRGVGYKFWDGTPQRQPPPLRPIGAGDHRDGIA